MKHDRVSLTIISYDGSSSLATTGNRCAATDRWHWARAIKLTSGLYESSLEGQKCSSVFTWNRHSCDVIMWMRNDCENSSPWKRWHLMEMQSDIQWRTQCHRQSNSSCHSRWIWTWSVSMSRESTMSWVNYMTPGWKELFIKERLIEREETIKVGEKTLSQINAVSVRFMCQVQVAQACCTCLHWTCIFRMYEDDDDDP